jgi:tetratricopeptide (TPR) repeat protein
MKRHLIYAILAMLCFTAFPSCFTFADDAAPTAPAAAPAEEPGQKAYEAGRNLFFLGKYNEAIEQFRAAVAADGTKTIYRLYLAKALRNVGQNDEAQQLFADILKENPDHVEAGLALAAIYEEKGKWADVIGVLQPLLEYKHDYTIYHTLAAAYYNQGDMKQARTDYEKAVEQNPNSPTDHYQLGNIYLGENRYAMAAAEYEKCQDLGIDTDVLHYKLGTAYSNLRNYLGNITEMGVKDGQPWTIKEGVYIIEAVPGKENTFYVAPTKSAIFQVERAIDMGIDEPAILFLRANIFLGAGRYEKAHALYAEMESKVGDAEKALFYHQFAEAAFGMGLYDEFLKYTDESIKLEPATYGPALVDAYLRVANRKNQAGDQAGYIEYLNKVVEQRPDAASYHLLLANAYRDAKDYANAVTHWKLTLELEPDRPDRIEILNLIQQYSKSQ